MASKYLAQCPECEKEFHIYPSSKELKQWNNKLLKVKCPECKEIIKPRSVAMGSPIHQNKAPTVTLTKGQ